MMRVMTYNILCGGHPMPGGPSRLEAILEVIQYGSPDILALQEANGFDDPAVAAQISKTLGLPYYAVTQAPPFDDGKRYNVVTFSRYPIRNIHRFKGQAFETGALSLDADSPLGPISICNVHLHSTDEARRLAEIKTVLSYQDSCGPQIILGDFNALSCFDPYTDDESEFGLQFDTIDEMNTRFIDLHHASRGGVCWTHPSRLPADHSRRLNRRIDYVFASPAVASHAGDVQAITSDRAHCASDHFPLIVDFI